MQPPPLLPGYTGYQTKGGDAGGYHGKGQSLRYKNGYATTTGDSLMMVSGDSGGGGSTLHNTGVPLSDGTAEVRLGSTSPGLTNKPKWVEYDRQVLRWFGYYTEEVPDSRIENVRIRKVVIRYYLENDTMDVLEPRQTNSGMDQGILFKRHKILKGADSQLMPADLVVGEHVTIYGKKIMVTDADEHTRQVMSGQGVELACAQSYPENYYDLAQTMRPGSPGRTATRQGTQSLAGAPVKQSLATYLANSGKVLRFFAVWDDRRSLFGDRRPYRVHYFLEDATVEVLETNENNSGRDSFPVFLRRGPLPRVQDLETTKTGKGIDRSLCYGPDDFRIGSFVNVYGRNLYLHDCDEFTRGWYKTNRGVMDDELAPIDVTEPAAPLPVARLPPYNGYGSQEDSMQNCASLTPKQPKRDFYKLMNKAKIVLRFRVRFADSGPQPLSAVDRERWMILSYFAANDTILIFEPPRNNSGVVGGKYLERSIVCKPKSADQFTDKDLYVGAVLDIHSRNFELVEADEFTLQYMESNRVLYPQADWQNAAGLIRDYTQDGGATLKAALADADVQGSGMISVEGLEQALDACGVPIIKHLCIALFRHLRQATPEGPHLPVGDLLGCLGMA